MENFVKLLYVVSAVFFILSLRFMSEVKSSRVGNISGAVGMLIAILATLIAFKMHRYDLLALALLVGAIVGVPIAIGIPMTAVPQRTALSHAFGSIAVALVGTAKYHQLMPNIDRLTMAVLASEMILGYLTFTGSIIAFLKLQENIFGVKFPSKPLIYPGRNIVTVGSLVVAVVMGIILVINPHNVWALPILIVFSLIFGFLLAMGIGGADMPTAIAILNSYAGISAAALGFVLDNKLLIVAGTLDGSSGFILAIIMCKAMNRSFLNVLFGGVGAKVMIYEEKERKAQVYTPDDAAQVLEMAQRVVIVPGYGMAAAQAQHAVKELVDVLLQKGIDVKFAIHPVAGRMPGHMNVLLAEAQVPYELLWELDTVNPLLPETDVALVIGANDITNPAAKTNSSSPLYGMPIIEVDKAGTVIFIKRSLTGTGFAGVDNELFYLPKTMMVLGDAKKVVTEIVAKIKKATLV